jgi:hypothetical protein
MDSQAGTPLHRPLALRVLSVVIVVLALSVTACSTHDVAATRTCTTVTKGGKVAAVSNRGAVGLAKIGLTPKGLKLQEKCK